MRVLVVDDEPDVLLLCRVNLAFSGHEVLEACDAVEGLEAAISLKPDLIVLDMMLPGGDGLNVLRQLQARADTRAIPVIMLTARTRAGDELAGYQTGATLYMTKPFSPAALSEAVSTIGEMSIDERESLRDTNVRQLAVLQGQ